MKRRIFRDWLLGATCSLVAAACIWGGFAMASPPPRVIEILADHQSRFSLPGQSGSVLTLMAGEPVLLRITAEKAKTRNRDGSVHGFTLLRLKDRTRVTGWDFLLKPGVQEFAATAPSEPGEYEAICTVICSGHHEDMTMKVVVIPSGNCGPADKGEGKPCESESK